ncbi:BnaA02g04030D [Brassica napus]|uniref:BnaA02g04030D protein n=1 Tax=Brassica napus TaxID=3708 RepID=A0A078ITU5_BRANA|nr:BnaA02g04030D [Brassica napus]
MGASRKLQGEIDRVLKKISASYEQSLTKTKAFSKEGLVVWLLIDPKEKAKSETRAWLNNVVSELESQIDSFEAELEGVSVKKEKTRPPRLFMLALFGLPTHHQSTSQEKTEDTTLPESNSETPPKAPPQKNMDHFQSRNETVIGSLSNIMALFVSFSPILELLICGLLGMPSLSGGNEKQFSSQQQNPLLEQSSAISPQGSLGIQAPAALCYRCRSCEK